VLPIVTSTIAGLLVILLAGLLTAVVGHIRGGHPFRWIGSRVVRLVRWIAGLRLSTIRSRRRLYDEGFQDRDEEVKRERAAAKQPLWRVTRDRGHIDDRTYWLTNLSWVAWDVRVDVDPLFFAFDEQPFFPGEFGDDTPGGTTGKWFSGLITDRGRVEGVTFIVEWRDANGDRHTAHTTFAAETLPLESRDEAYMRGRTELQAEIDDRRAKPIRRPRWLVGKVRNGSTGWMLINASEGSIATEVTLDAESAWFVITGAADWEDGNGVARLPFNGILTTGGRSFGVDFYIEWNDREGERQSATFHYEPPGF
jgi:hypothetical protein